MSRRDVLRRCTAVALVVGVWTGCAAAAAVDAPHVQVELVADQSMLAPGQDASVGVRFVPENGWHVYWRNPGDSGEAPTITWSLPDGFSAGEIQWPAPKRIPFGPLTNYGYEGAVLLPVSLRVPVEPATTSADIHARARWLVCNPEECIPGEAPLSLSLSIGASPAPSPHAPLFSAARARMAIAPPPAWQLSASATAMSVTLRVDGFDAPLPRPPLFFPHGRESIEPSAPQSVAADDGGFALTLQRWPQATEDVLDGVLVVGDNAYEITVPLLLSAASGERNPLLGPPPLAGEGRRGLLAQPLLFALLGGLLLNLMPCVFPVLALKGLALVNLAGEGRRRARVHGMLYGAGVVLSFWLLAGVLLALRAGGEQLGWGFQLQSPAVIIALAALFFWMALTLLDLTTIGASIMGIGNNLTAGVGHRSAFFTGVLATVVATPCTAPFMGTALGYALVQPPLVALMIFTSLGIGLALPYVVISFVPALSVLMPRPGAWMETLKQLLAFPLLATVVWLVWVVSLQGGPAAVVATLSVLLLLSFAVWIVERSRGRWARVAAVVAMLAAFIIGGRVTPHATAPIATGTGLAWEPYSTARIDELLQQGKPVFVDFTAAWCVTCQVNKQLVLDTEIIAKKMREVGIVALRADWTRRNPDISRALQQFGRDGVPLYVVYSGRDNEPPRILPQILTSQIVITELEQLERGNRT